MFSRFFIDRPIFASVLSIVITLAGGLSLFTLPVAQYPAIAPPTVEVSAVYPGANAQVVSNTVAAPIEQQVNGVEGMMYMSSQCTNDGTYSLTVTFQNGVDLNVAQVLVQNRVALAQAILPDLVKRRGVGVKKKSPSVLMIVNLVSPDGSRDNLYLSNYATIQLRDELSRLSQRSRALRALFSRGSRLRRQVVEGTSTGPFRANRHQPSWAQEAADPARSAPTAARIAACESRTKRLCSARATGFARRAGQKPGREKARRSYQTESSASHSTLKRSSPRST